jgi:hypothetical protein
VNSKPLPLDATIIAAIERRLSPEQREVVEAVRQTVGRGRIEFWNSWLGPTGGGWGCSYAYVQLLGEPLGREGEAHRAAARHLRDIRHEREDADVEAAHAGLAATEKLADVATPRRDSKPERSAKFRKIAERMREDIVADKTTKEDLAALRDKELMSRYPGGSRQTTRKALKSIDQ